MKNDFTKFDPVNPTEKMKYPYRRGKARQPSQRRINKVKDRKMYSFNVLLAYATVPLSIPGFIPFFSFIGAVVTKFFLVQYLEKFRIIRIPVKHVDHELDEKVPFKPENLDIYLDFINFWIRPIAMLVKRFGVWNGAKLGAEYLSYINLCYRQAYRMYTSTMTTTYRPYCELRSIRAMRKADPHYLCVPSLHITICCLTYGFYKMLFERENFTEEEKQNWLSEIFDHARGISETVLYLKQHSVNCIPAAMYMLTKITPELFTAPDAVKFIENLFVNVDDVTKEDKEKIFHHIDFIFERFLLEGAQDDDWLEPVQRWLDSYQPFEPSYAATAQ